MHSLSRCVSTTAIIVATCGSAERLAGQMHSPESMAADTAARRIDLRAQAIALVTRIDPGPGNRSHTEGYVAQPLIMAHARAFRGHVSGVLTLDLEGLTLDRGQLNPGAYGEGYVDRRHPHTYIHEAIASASGAFLGIEVSVSGGKGFVPFGTDDPMMRPFATYPVNHHLAQILERYVAIAAVRRGPVTLEGALFNGDEPVSPGAPPDADRFGDSWATRATIVPIEVLEVEGSFASVESPEIAAGGGRDQRKWSVGGRTDAKRGAFRGAFIEWARTDELVGNVRVSRFSSVLGEATFGVGASSVSARVENTTRPEDERLSDPFRFSRTPTDLGIIGITRWRIGTVAVSIPARVRRATVTPFVEISYASPREELTPSAFTPRDFYGASEIWSASVGVRLGVGAMMHRMGRYGVALLSPNAGSMAAMSDHMNPQHHH